MNKKYIPPKVWQYNSKNGGKFANINLPTSGAQTKEELPKGKNPIQLYSLGTPNCVKVTIMLEELISKGIEQAQYDAFLIDIQKGKQFTSGFVELNPNSKIPALIDTNEKSPTTIFESGAILLYLADKFSLFISKEQNQRAKILSWLFWQVASAPYLGGGFGHFYAYAEQKIEYAINRFAMETKRQLDVLDQQLAKHKYIVGDEYTIADIAIFPWYGALVSNKLYDAAEFLNVKEYKNITRWVKTLIKRKALLKGRLVNRVWGDENQQLKERHLDSNFANLKLDY